MLVIVRAWREHVDGRRAGGGREWPVREAVRVEMGWESAVAAQGVEMAEARPVSGVARAGPVVAVLAPPVQVARLRDVERVMETARAAGDAAEAAMAARATARAAARAAAERAAARVVARSAVARAAAVRAAVARAVEEMVVVRAVAARAAAVREAVATVAG